MQIYVSKHPNIHLISEVISIYQCSVLGPNRAADGRLRELDLHRGLDEQLLAARLPRLCRQEHRLRRYCARARHGGEINR